MPDLLHQPWRLGLVTSSEEEDWLCQQKHTKEFRHRPIGLLRKEYLKDPSQWHDNRISKAGPAYTDYMHKFTKESLWIDGCYNPPQVFEELPRQDLPLPTHAPHTELWPKNKKLTHHKSLPCNDESSSFVAVLRACAKRKDLSKGTRVHDDILRRGLLGKCSDALATMYAKCGVLAKARELLEMHKSRDVITWTALISGYAREGQSQNALDCFEWMQREGLSPDAVT
eukprot:c25164_g14_i2 orf=136-816(+)